VVSKHPEPLDNFRFFCFKRYSELDELYLNLYEVLNKYINIFEELANEQNLEDILTLCSIVLVYLEIQFSKFRELQKARQQKPKEVANLINEKLENENLQLLIFKLNKLEYFLDQHCTTSLENKNVSQDILKASTTFKVRSACLGLFASFNEDSISSDYYIKHINDHLETHQNTPITVANSKIFQSITKESLKDFLKMNKKNKIFKLENKIAKYFVEKNYKEIINQLEEFAENHQITFDDENLNTQIFSHLLHSYYELNQYEKCGFFGRKFLRQIIAYLNEQNNLALLAATGTGTDLLASEKNNAEIIALDGENLDDMSNPKSKKLKDIFDFLSDILDLIHK
jgi:hypothetical protein